jgi:hypothetical protein
MRTRQPRKRQSQSKGLQVVGPGFYLWDTSPREAIRLAAELSQRRKLLSVQGRRAPLRVPGA